MSYGSYLSKSQLVAVFYGLIAPMLAKNGYCYVHDGDEPHSVQINRLGSGYRIQPLGQIDIKKPRILYRASREDKKLDEIFSNFPIISKQPSSKKKRFQL